MKGVYLTTFILLFLTAIFLYFLLRSTSTAYAESVRLSATLQAGQIAGLINTMQASPANAVHKYTLPKTSCFVKIDNAVTVSDAALEGKVSYTANLIKTDIEIKPATIECKSGKDVTLYITKCGSAIEILDSERRCDV